MEGRHFLWGAAGLTGAIVVFCAVLWQPERQVRLHQSHFLKAVEKRDWPRLYNSLANNYSDRWGHEKNSLLTTPREVLQQFFALSIEARDPALSWTAENRAAMSVRLRLGGAGGPLAPLVINRVNALAAPFGFDWQKQSWKPWDWKLVEVHQAQLEEAEF